MAYRKRYARRHKKPKTSTLSLANKSVKVASTAYRAMSLASKLARFVNTEFKYYTSDTFDSVASTGSIFNIFSPAQGDTDQTRDGDSCKLMRTSGRMLLSVGASATSSQTVRIIIFRGKQEAGTSPAISDVINMTSSSDFIAPKPYDLRFKTKILYDRLHTVNIASGGATQKVIYINIRHFGHCQFDAGTTTVNNGGLYMALISTAAANVPTLQWQLRTTFTDN